MRALVTGCAGFIGSTLTDRLLAAGHTVVGIDNFSTGLPRFLDQATQWNSFKLVHGNLNSMSLILKSMKDIDQVFHMAANADVRFGTAHPRRDIEQNTLVTHNVLEAMRLCGVKNIVFASTGSVYGEARVFPTPENAPFPVQTSFYAASKLAAEGLIEAYCEGFGFRALIFRFVSILGERYTHGHVVDFYKQLVADQTKLTILGDGQQKKSYLYVQDCIDAIMIALENAEGPVNILNLGTDEYCRVYESVKWICERMNVNPTLECTGGVRGWVGDNPFIFLDCAKMRSLGWRPKLSIREGVEATVDFLKNNPWVMESR
jgi:UDP-glucose 4-epimerase